MVRLTGIIKNGHVVLDQQSALAEGTRVTVEPAAGESRLDSGSFWKKRTLQEIIEEQGTKPVRSVDDFRGGWPPEEINDGFEEWYRQQRQADRDRSA